MRKIDSAHWKELSPLLDEVLDLGSEARVVWLEALGATRPEAAAELRGLLAELQSLDDVGFMQGDPEAVQKLRRVLLKLAGT
jgi:hypothetical protein